jgi:hypothetical protein
MGRNNIWIGFTRGLGYQLSRGVVQSVTAQQREERRLYLQQEKILNKDCKLYKAYNFSVEGTSGRVLGKAFNLMNTAKKILIAQIYDEPYDIALWNDYKHPELIDEWTSKIEEVIEYLDFIEDRKSIDKLENYLKSFNEGIEEHVDKKEEQDLADIEAEEQAQAKKLEEVRRWQERKRQSNIDTFKGCGFALLCIIFVMGVLILLN